MIKITSGEGVHVCKANDDKTLFIDTYSNVSLPGITRIVNSEGKEQRKLVLQKTH
ncbi:MAG: hypothetical protein IPM91_03980 [Bacteroidetes bacterium]|nr:hypothetical protein [Bacteroidota bacterium]